MKIYTKTGDRGTTSLVYGERVSKTDLRVEAYGTCDEANSIIGFALSCLKNEEFEGKQEILEIFHKVQTSLFHVGAEISTPADKEVKWKVAPEDIAELEQVMDKWNEIIPPLQNFILPGGHPAGASMHVARTTIRRAERKAVAIGEGVNPLVFSYLNRLSDFLFIAARYVNYCLHEQEMGLHQ